MKGRLNNLVSAGDDGYGRVGSVQSSLFEMGSVQNRSRTDK